MLIYLEQAWQEVRSRCASEGRKPALDDLHDAIMHGAVERVRPKMMTVVAIMAGLLPILWSTGTGSGEIRPIAAPMVGGRISPCSRHRWREGGRGGRLNGRAKRAGARWCP